MILEPLTINNTCLDMIIKVEALSILGEIYLCQRLGCDLQGGSDGKQKD
jgi:hypothetical protein